MGSLLLDRLQQAQGNRKMVAVHANGAAFLGYILSVNPDVLVLRSITRQGLLTGLRSLRMEDVSRVDFDDRYIRLVEFKEHNPEIAFTQPAAPEGIEEMYVTMEAMLRQAKDARQLVFVETTSEAGFYGYIAEMTDEEVLLDVYTQYGEADGQTVLNIERIRYVVWSDEDVKTIELLLRQRPRGGPEKS